MFESDGRPTTHRAGPSLQPDFDDFHDSFQTSTGSFAHLTTTTNVMHGSDMIGDARIQGLSQGGGGGIARRAPPSNLPQMTAKDWARIRNARDPTSGGKQAIGRTGELLATVPQEAEEGNDEEGEEDEGADEPPGVLL